MIAVVAAVGIVWNLDGDEGVDGTTPATIGVDTDIEQADHVDDYLVDLRTGRSTPIEGLSLPGDLDVSPDGTSIASERGTGSSSPISTARTSNDSIRRRAGGAGRSPLVTRWADDRVPGARTRDREDRQPLRPRRGLGRGDAADRSRTDQRGHLVHVAELQPRRWIGPVHESSSVRFLCLLDRQGRSAGLAPLVDPGVRRGADARAPRCRLRRVLAGRQHDRVHADLGRRRVSAAYGSRTRTEATAGSSSTANSTSPRWSPDGTRIAVRRRLGGRLGRRRGHGGDHEGRGSRRVARVGRRRHARGQPGGITGHEGPAACRLPGQSVGTIEPFGAQRASHGLVQAEDDVRSSSERETP